MFCKGDYVYYHYESDDGTWATEPGKVLGFSKARVKVEVDTTEGTRTKYVKASNLSLQDEHNEYFV